VFHAKAGQHATIDVFERGAHAPGIALTFRGRDVAGVNH
jgi:hypothetical protein